MRKRNSELFSKYCKKKFKKLKVKNVKIINIDARKFDNYGNYDYVYLYNPFSKKILNTVIKKIVRQSSKKVKIIYNNPVGHQIILKHKFF